MSSDKFGLTAQEMKALTTPIFSIAEIVIPTQMVNAIPRCPADNHVLECAIEGKCSFIVSGDRRDLLILKKFQHVDIITARQLIDRI